MVTEKTMQPIGITSTICGEHISTSFPTVAGQADYTPTRHENSLTHIESYHADYVIYTGGSASEGTRNGGAAAVVTGGSSLLPDVLATIQTKGRSFTSSNQEETAVIEPALTWTSTNANHLSITILICTNSRSLCEAFMSSNLRISSVHGTIN